jgi:hypothetical protein
MGLAALLPSLKPSLEAAVLGAGPHAGLSGFDATEDQLEASDNE